jgi:hypothetical protein
MDVVDLVEEDQGEDLGDPGDRSENMDRVGIVSLGGLEDVVFQTALCRTR